MKPLIAITPSPSRDTLAHGTFLRYAMAAAYVEAVLAAGGIPVILPPQDGHSGPLLDAVQGLLLSGGGDVDPSRYGAAEVHPTTYGVSAERDRFEIELFEEAVARDLPVLGICRGLQVMNVALGGSLLQDIAATPNRPLPLPHRQQEVGLESDAVGHPVSITAGSPVADLFRTGEVGVNSFHHQAIADPAPGLEIAASAPDGFVEAVSLPGRRFVVGVQWHPELMYVRHPAQLRLFAGLVGAATARSFAVH
ncbi:MAG: Glutamine amidotransferase, class I [uncultured Thermomicrobiales bacterium]|uniref:Glutamine amidotransferase, class I n=1 Tax=uncultured Thermomicrobiales bacterium TaxID=1645740 RepID=A0A6J4U610_9BACT|nr:MAG: Glutamine amidotransferase, class I [uncultured Thermomicrobiales bacterium]